MGRKFNFPLRVKMVLTEGKKASVHGWVKCNYFLPQDQTTIKGKLQNLTIPSKFMHDLRHFSLKNLINKLLLLLRKLRKMMPSFIIN